MDGFMSAGVAGILFAEDFGEPDPVPAGPGPEPAPLPPALTQDDVDAACIRAVRSAERAWGEGAAERRAVALEALAAGLAEARAAAAAAAEAVAEGVARAMLGVLAGVLPDLCRAHGDAEVRALLRQVLPEVGAAGPVVVRVHAGLLAALEADLAALDGDLVDRVELRAANLPPGDARLGWEHGGMVRDAAALAGTVRDCLSRLGLLPGAEPDDVPDVFNADNRSLAHAAAH